MPFATYTTLTSVGAPAFSAGNYTLSSNGLTFTTNTHGDAQLYNDSPQSAGSYYFEIDIVNGGSYNASLAGVCNAALVGNTELVTNGNHACVIDVNNGNVYLNGTEAISFGAFPGGAGVVSICVALPNLIWFALNGGNWNNSSTANPATGVGGISLTSITPPFNIVVDLAENGGQAIANFGQTSYAYPSLIPELFSNWPPQEEIILNPVSSVTTQNLSLTGTASMALSAGIDYSLDGGATWTEATGFSGSITFSASGPSFAYPAAANIIVRDHASTYGTSNSEAFTAGTPIAGSLIFQDNFESYSDLSDAESGGWEFSYNQTAYPSYNPIGVASGGSSNWLCLGGGGTQTATGNTFAQHTFSGLAKGAIAFDFGPVGSSFDNFYNGVIAIGYLTSGFLVTNLIGLSPIPNSSYTTYSVAIAGPTGATAGTFSVPVNEKHYYEVDFDTTVFPNTININIDGSSVWEGTLTGTYSAASVNVFQLNNNNSAEMQIDNIKVYNTGYGISLGSVKASYGQYASLTGTFTNSYNPTALQYQLDSGAWGTVTGYGDVSEAWNGFGPLISDFSTHTIRVRDEANPGVLSNTLTFAAQNGVFVWNNIPIS